MIFNYVQNYSNKEDINCVFIYIYIYKASFPLNFLLRKIKFLLRDVHRLNTFNVQLCMKY